MAYKQQKLILHSSKAWTSKIRQLAQLSAGEAFFQAEDFLYPHTAERRKEKQVPLSRLKALIPLIRAPLSGPHLILINSQSLHLLIWSH